jgi:hypothetical protein
MHRLRILSTLPVGAVLLPGLEGVLYIGLPVFLSHPVINLRHQAVSPPWEA